MRALAALANGRADPVATATLAAACLAIGLGTMFYAHFIHSYVMWALGWFFTILLYIIGVALFGPQNYFLVKAHVKKKRERQRMRALAGFDPNGHAALQIQDFYRAYICVRARPYPLCPSPRRRRDYLPQASTPRSSRTSPRKRGSAPTTKSWPLCGNLSVRRAVASIATRREILISTQGGREESRPRRGESES